MVVNIRVYGLAEKVWGELGCANSYEDARLLSLPIKLPQNIKTTNKKKGKNGRKS